MFLEKGVEDQLAPFALVFRGVLYYYAMRVLVPYTEDEDRFQLNYDLVWANDVPLRIPLKGTFGASGDAIPMFGELWRDGKYVGVRSVRFGALREILPSFASMKDFWESQNSLEERKKYVQDLMSTWVKYPWPTPGQLKYLQDSWESETQPFLASNRPTITEDVRNYYLNERKDHVPYDK